MGKIKAAGLDLQVDGARNIMARMAGKSKVPAIVTGSHIDSVPGGGHLDGALGVLCGLECLRRMRELDVDLKRPVELIAFTDEEGRFGSMIGSRAFCGRHSLDDLQKATDEHGYRLEDALQKYNSSCEAVINARRSPEDVHAYIELHIEQGPVLDLEKTSIGIVTEIVGLFRWRALLKGAANHAGTTPMHLRRDAFKGLVRFAAGIDQTLGDYGSQHSRATIGKVVTRPGSIGVIPGEVRFLFDVRESDGGRLERLRQVFENQIRQIAQENSLELSLETTGELSPVKCDQLLTETIENNVAGMGIRYRRLPSGAAHDAVTMASIASVAMIFIPSIGGVSHSYFENSNWIDIENGANVLLNTLSSLGQTI